MTRPDSTLPRIVFGIAVLVFLGAVYWTVDSAVEAYEAYRRERTTAAQPAAPDVAAEAEPPAPPPAPEAAKGSEESPASQFEDAHARLQAQIEASIAALAKETPVDPGEEPMRVGGEVTEPVKIAGPAPAYTQEALAARLEGLIVVEVVIERDGRVSSARVLHGLSPELDDKVRSDIEQWRFAPATRNGRPVRAYYTLRLNFQLR